MVFLRIPVKIFAKVSLAEMNSCFCKKIRNHSLRAKFNNKKRKDSIGCSFANIIWSILFNNLQSFSTASLRPHYSQFTPSQSPNKDGFNYHAALDKKEAYVQLTLTSTVLAEVRLAVEDPENLDLFTGVIMGGLVCE